MKVIKTREQRGAKMITRYLVQTQVSTEHGVDEPPREEEALRLLRQVLDEPLEVMNNG